MCRSVLCLLLLAGCPAPPTSTTGGDTDEDTDLIGSPDLDRSLSEAGVCTGGAATARPSGPFTEARGPSPYGTGPVRTTLGALDGEVPPLANPRAVDTSLDLSAWAYDLYVPPDYDGSEPYGLIAFINSGGDGAPREAWKEVLDARKLIWVGPRDAGNPVNVDVRMGAALLGTARALEQLHIDRSRVYASGNSGGARTASVLTWITPDVFVGAAPLCGAGYFRQVAQDFETHEPDSHYEFWGDFYYPDQDGEPFASFAWDNDPRWAIMTSFGDFREGDIFNIQHNGLRLDGFDVRVLETAGGHCATNTSHLDDALAFLESLDHTVEDDTFDDAEPRSGGLGAHGWALGTTADATLEEAGGRLLMRPAGGRAVLVSRAATRWRSPGGLTLRTVLGLDGTIARLSLIANQPERSLSELGTEDWPALHVIIDDGVEPATLEVRAGGLEGEARLLFAGSFEPGSLNGSVPVEVHAWTREVQVIVPGSLTPSDTGEALPGALMNDNKSVRIRLAALDSTWRQADWPSAALAIEARGEGSLSLDRVRLHDDSGLDCE